MKKSNKVLLSAIAMAGLLASAGCSAGTGDGGQEFDPSTVTGSFDWQRYKGESLNVMFNEHPWTTGLKSELAKFTELTGITVNLQSYAEELYFDKMEQSVRSTNPPDVYMLPMDDFAATHYAAGLMEPLTPYLESSSLTASDYNLADFPDGLLAPGRFPAGDANAKLYELPISTEAYILFYNKDLVEKFLGGVVPETMAGLINAAKKITAEGNGEVFGSVMRGVRSDTPRDTLTGMVLNQWPKDRPVEAPYNVWFNGGWDKPILNDPNIVRGVADYAELLAAGPANKFNIDWPDATSLFAQGKVAFFIDASVFGPSFEDPAASAVVGKVGYSTLPKGDVDGTTGVWSWSLAMAKNGSNKGASWLFTQWATSSELTAKLGAGTGGAPRQSSAADPSYTSGFNQQYVQAINDSMADARTTAVIRDGWKEGVYVIVDGMLAIANGGDPATAMADANEKLKQTIK